MRVVLLTEEGVTLEDEKKGKPFIITNLSDVMQFELDQSLFQYEPHYHYDLQPSPKLDDYLNNNPGGIPASSERE
jgi:hypothetical protein